MKALASKQLKDTQLTLEYAPIAFVQESVKRPHTATAERFERYKAARTVHEARRLGARPEDFRRDLRDGTLLPGSKLGELGVTAAVRLFAPADCTQIAFAKNPKKPGSQAWARYERYGAAQTLGEAKMLGIWPGDIRNDMMKGYLGTAKTPWDAMSLKRWPAAASKAPGRGAARNKAGVRKLQQKAYTKAAVGEKGARQQPVAGKKAARTKAAGTRKAVSRVRAQPLAWSRKCGWS